MKHLTNLIALIVSIALFAVPAAACELSRGTIVSDGPLKGQMVVKCDDVLIGTRTDLEAAGVNIWNPAEVLMYAGGSAFLPKFGGEGRRPGPDGILNTADDILEGENRSW